MKTLQALLFDLDGTLMDTAPEIGEALNRTLRSLGRSPASAGQVVGWIGDGARALVGKALGEPASDAAWERFIAEYADCCTASLPYPGTDDLLRRLRAQGLRLAVLTNKESAFANRLLELRGLAGHFDLIVAGDTLPFRKPDPRVVAHALDVLRVTAEETVLVGDSVTDVRTARAAGVRAWTVRHGYPGGAFTGSDRPDAFIDGFDGFDPRAMALLSPPPAPRTASAPAAG